MGPALVVSLVHVFGQTYWNMIVPFFFGLKFQAMYASFALWAFDILMGGR